MIKYGGNIVDAYGIVNVISPAGLPIRGIVGISPDPIMFVAVNSVDIEKSTEFYNRLGFVEQVRPTSLLLSLLSRAPLIRFLPGVSVLPTKQGRFGFNPLFFLLLALIRSKKTSSNSTE